MTDPFAIDVPSTSVTIEEGSTGAGVALDVGNTLDRHVRAGIDVRAQAPVEPSWVRLQPASFDLGANESRRVTLAVEPPAGVEPGELRFTLRVYDVDKPSEVFTESPVISVALRRAPSREGPPPSGRLAAALGWFAGALAGLLVGGLGGWRLFAPGPAGEFETFGEALGAAIGDVVGAAILALLLALLLAWVLSAVGVWLALRLRGHSRRALTGGLTFGLGIPWFLALLLAGRLADAVTVLGWLAFLALVVANPGLLARLLVLRGSASRRPAAAAPKA